MLRFILVVATLGSAVIGQTCVYTGNPSFASVPISSNSAFFAFGPSAGYQQRAQYLVPAPFFGNVPYLIRDFSLPVKFGSQTIKYARIEIRMAHTTVTSLSNTFANNITEPLVDAMVSDEFTITWGPGPRWVPIGLQYPFAYLPSNGNLLIDILVYGPSELIEEAWFSDFLPGYGISGKRSGQQLQLPTSGVTTNPPVFRFCLDQAAWSVLGQACDGTTLTGPQLGLTGMPSLGGASTFWVHNTPSNSLALLALGFSNVAPYPIDLGGIGAPGCYQYFPIATAVAVATNSSGVGSHTVAVANDPMLIGQLLFGQYAALTPGQNTLGLLTSNYGRLLLGQ